MIDIISKTACVLIVLFSTWKILKPFTCKEEIYSNDKNSVGILRSQNERLQHALKDLELDLSLGNLTQAEFDEFKKDLHKEVS